MEINPFIIKICLISIMLCIALITDLRYGRIHNIITLPAMFIGIVVNAIVYYLADYNALSIFWGIAHSLGGIATGAGIFFVFYALGWFGGGDAKLVGAIGAFMGAGYIFMCTLYILVAGGICSILKIIYELAIKKNATTLLFLINLKNKTLYNTPMQMPDKNKASRFPYAIAIAIGFAYMVIWG